MSKQQFTGRESRALRRYEYDDSYVVAVDLGGGDGSIDVDVVGETAIVVVDRDGEVSEAEFELPGPNGTATVNNGVLTVTVPKED